MCFAVQPMPHFAENPDRDFSAGYADIEQQRAATTQHEPDPDVRQRICADLLRVVWNEWNCGRARGSAKILLREADLAGRNQIMRNWMARCCAALGLPGASLWSANLRQADLRNTNLHGAKLDHADLRGADLRGADLADDSFWGAHFEGADLPDAKGLTRAQIVASVDANTHLPAALVR
jgi:hypothetical protein